MNINEYLRSLNSESQKIFESTLKFQSELGKAHHFSACLHEFAEKIDNPSEKKILIAVSSQMESATLTACLGMYRQAFASLRLALEMGLGAVYFSIHQLELQEWINGRADIQWSALIDENNGVLSDRFAKAFFKEFSEHIAMYHHKTSGVYRKLSEYVHGNNETWLKSRLELHYNDELLLSYFANNEEVAKIILYVLSCRYLKTFSSATLESLEFIPEEMSHLSYVREYFGGPKV